jgi:EAL domain-containing protein (putative c-di-GMP-specific phosphodiesterase class I)/CheY-like chemotaxis protein
VRRLNLLASLQVVGTPPDQVLDGLTRVAARVTHCPMALVTLIDAEHQWFKARYGWDATHGPRADAFCTHTIVGHTLMEVPDTQLDARFRDNPHVVGDPHLRFYAGVPIEVDGIGIGALCVLDTRPRQLDDDQRELLQDLARGVQHWMSSRQQQIELRQRQSVPADPAAPPSRGTPVGEPANAERATHPSEPIDPRAELPELDEGMLARLIGNNQATISRLQQKYLVTAQQASGELRDAVAKGDWKGAAAIAHRLKSSSRTIGAMALGSLCHDMEMIGSSVDAAELAGMLPAFDAALARVVERLKPRLEPSSPEPLALPHGLAGVLLVDDEAFQLQLMQQQLAQLGVAPVHGCSSGAEALDWLAGRDSTPILLLLDLNMPGMDGVQFMRHLMTRGYAGALALISGADKRVLDTAAKLAAAHSLSVLSHLQKPVQPEALRQLVERWRSFIPVKARQARKQYPAAEIARGIAAGELVLHYQPKVAMRSGEVVGVEALVRWQHPRDGLVYPDAFIAAAEAGGCIDALTEAVLGIALQQARSWRDAGHPMRVAVNVSMDNLDRLDFAGLVLDALRDRRVPTTDLTLELTESQLSLDLRAAMDSLTRLRLNGVGLSIDDFGTGHSSLAQLRDFPFNELKIDRGFVHGSHGDATRRAIFTASLEMAHQLSMQVVAEGVEDVADWGFARDAGCDSVQGYFVARPMPADDLPTWRTQWQARHPGL